jgi:hypothetical protein
MRQMYNTYIGIYIQQEHFIVPLIQMYLLNKETEREREHSAYKRNKKEKAGIANSLLIYIH